MNIIKQLVISMMKRQTKELYFIINSNIDNPREFLKFKALSYNMFSKISKIVPEDRLEITIEVNFGIIFNDILLEEVKEVIEKKINQLTTCTLSQIKLWGFFDFRKNLTEEELQNLLKDTNLKDTKINNKRFFLNILGTKLGGAVLEELSDIPESKFHPIESEEKNAIQSSNVITGTSED